MINTDMINTLGEFYDLVKEYTVVRLAKNVIQFGEIFIHETSLDKLLELAKKEDESVLFVLVDRSSIERKQRVLVTVYVIYKTFLLESKLDLEDE